MAVGQAGSMASVAGVGAGASAGATTGTGGSGSMEDCLIYSTAPQSPVGSLPGSHNEALGLSPPTSPARASQVTVEHLPFLFCVDQQSIRILKGTLLPPVPNLTCSNHLLS